MVTASKGNFVWHEHLTKDPKKAIAFYSEVLGWKTQPFDEHGHYTMWVGSQGPLGGVMTLPDEAAKMGVPPHWMGHVQVDDVDAAAAQVKSLGGNIYKAPTDIPTVGRFAIVADPQGAVFSLFKPQNAMTLHDSSKPGEFCWNELMTSDSAAAVKFYSTLLGWKVIQEMDMGPAGTYRIFGIGDKALGGMMTAPKDVKMPPAWIYYVETADLGAATSRATKQGAKVLNGPMDVPGGRITQLQDPQGAVFALHQVAKS